jgi:molybdenum cofactor synthesis domain-containing protein
MDEIVTAGMVVIGDEILSGRIQDRNVTHLAAVMTAVGVMLREVRIIGDDEDAIVEAVNALRFRYDHVFTTGGIGPTHDDITADSVARAFGVACTPHPETFRQLAEHYAKRGMEFTPARQRMARMPEGAQPIANPISVAPGFSIGNVHVMAGVPEIFQAMLDSLLPSLKTGARLMSVAIHCPFGEGVVGDRLGAIQKAHPDTIIGSYPKFRDGRFWTELVVRGRSMEAIDAARRDIEAMLDDLSGEAA